ncbi:hypothetical protein CC78DRAFT_608283 [Lojkania enalia]|uniref:Uncharacterized protein n=1 Tax=Lojkania enalia TaxID=147567 RepID=A0A9P4K8K8_9PLEO|nr:hypothetical protein CC78DRAFT_608283 [Didymosphaeria enalia]
MSTQTASKSELGIHWESPVLMYACFLGGIVFSILHHVFNASLHGQSVLDDNEQQWVQRAGTAIAFLVKLLFTTATGTAYTQWFWYRMRESPKTLKIADILFGIVYQPFTFVYIRVWAHHLPLAFLAIVTW